MEQTEVNSKNWKSLIKPAKLDVQLSDDKSFAKIVASFSSIPLFSHSVPVILIPRGKSLGRQSLIEEKISSGNLILFSKLPPYLSLRLFEIGDKN